MSLKVVAIKPLFHQGGVGGWVVKDIDRRGGGICFYCFKYFKVMVTWEVRKRWERDMGKLWVDNLKIRNTKCL